MGKWSDYFEACPEENPANYVNGVFNPQMAQQLREQDKKSKAALEVANAEVNSLIAKSKSDTKRQALIDKADCPQCGMQALHLYRISDTYYLCECQDCGIYGKGPTQSEALRDTYDAMGEGRNWRDNAQPF